MVDEQSPGLSSLFHNPAGFFSAPDICPRAAPPLIQRPAHMTEDIVLASGSSIRAQLLRNAGVAFTVSKARVDEAAVRSALAAEAATPHAIADVLAELKARKASSRHPCALVIGCDQILELKGQLLSKPASPEDAISQLSALRGNAHRLLSAVVVCKDAEPLWRHVGTVRLHMRPVSDGYLSDYVARNWASIRDAVGCYKLEEEGVRLFDRIEGDYFSVLGLPLVELLSWLALRGTLHS